MVGFIIAEPQRELLETLVFPKLEIADFPMLNLSFRTRKNFKDNLVSISDNESLEKMENNNKTNC